MDPATASITAAVLEAPARSGDGSYAGVCSTHLARVPAGGTVFVFVRPPSIPFAPPENPHVPMIMVGAGTGLAPFRGFLQERAALRDQHVPIGPSLLFVGCRHPETDLLYAEELVDFEKQGGGADLADQHLPGAHRRGGERRQGLARRAACGEPAGGGHLGRLTAAQWRSATPLASGCASASRGQLSGWLTTACGTAPACRLHLASSRL